MCIFLLFRPTCCNILPASSVVVLKNLCFDFNMVEKISLYSTDVYLHSINHTLVGGTGSNLSIV